MSAILQARGLSLGYADLTVVWDVDLVVTAGEVVALIGSNGAGKTTLLRGLSGLLAARTGTILWENRPLQAVPAWERVRMGLALCAEGRQLFNGFTVEENLLMGAYTRPGAEVPASLDQVYDLFPELATHRRRIAGDLSGGQQQMCAIGRALMSRPRLLMIDEMSLGLAPVAVDRLLLAIERVHARGVTVLLVEQDVPVALSISQHAYVVEAGRVSLSGPSAELLGDPHVREAYLGL